MKARFDYLAMFTSKNSETPVWVQHKSSTYRPIARDYSWYLFEYDPSMRVKGDVVLAHVPRKPRRPRVITPFRNSWADKIRTI